ncbi:helix-turn-helix domain-containing protein [Algicella marina]|uniref:helix-turn-helix domain-containing protein n=1 Tax=Algicella marina TaxID=2683284 RepID=UPI00137AAD47|nr:RodZ domain-containing protein [Algicella marina]
MRGERATLGKSLLDVQRDLRIKASYIAAIENCDTDVFPNKGFVAGYVRSYARYLGLDPEAVFQRFSVESGFSGVNAELTPQKRRAGGQQVLSGPVRVDRQDPLFSPVMSSVTAQASRFSDFSFSALGSLLVLFALIGGLGYGGMAVLRDIQRVDIRPIDQRPEAISDVTEIVAPGQGTVNVLPDDHAMLGNTRRDQSLQRMYEPEELATPVFTPRDGPIVEIDPNSIVSVANRSSRPLDGIAAGSQLAETRAAAQEVETPQVRVEPETPVIAVIAQRPAWVRVYQQDGTILFEKILETGEMYTLPADTDGPLIRAGNAGSVYLAVNQKLYGPIGSGTGVAKNVSMLPGDVADAFKELTEIPDVMQASLAAAAAAE